MIQLGVAMLIVTVILFLLAFVSKRRFGLMGLSLAAGSVLSGVWVIYAGDILSFFGTERSSSLESAIGVGLILLPAFVTLFHGYSYFSLYGRLLGALAFAVVGVSFLSQPLTQAFINTGQASEFVAIFSNYKDVIIGVGLIIAVIDLFLSNPRKR